MSDSYITGDGSTQVLYGASVTDQIPYTLSGDTDNLYGPGFSNATTILLTNLTSGGTVNLNGLAGGIPGRRMRLMLVAGYTVIINAFNSSNPLNDFVIQNSGQSLTLDPGEYVDLIYQLYDNGAFGGWSPSSVPPSNAGGGGGNTTLSAIGLVTASLSLDVPSDSVVAIPFSGTSFLKNPSSEIAQVLFSWDSDNPTELIVTAGTAEVPGFIEFVGSVFSNQTIVAGYIYAGIAKNGDYGNLIGGTQTGVSAGNQTYNFSVIVPLTPNQNLPDFYELVVFQNSGSDITFNDAPTTFLQALWFS